ncbi:MAG: DUF2231 domain-containing protein [Acidimicrobiales bacterium]
MEIDELFGLPAHPLFVHGAVVLLPLAATVTIVVSLFPRTRRSYAPVAVAMAIMATILVGLAQGSGEELEDRVVETELVEAHADKGEGVLPWAIGVTLAAVAVVAVAALSQRFPNTGFSRRSVSLAIAAFALLTGIAATWVVVDVGHSGAKATWDDTPAENDEYDDD